METHVGPTPTARQMSGSDPDERSILAVLVRRTYRLHGDGSVERAEEQAPLTVEVQMDEKTPWLMRHDTDLYPLKLATDVVLKGHAYPPQGKAPHFEASIQAGKWLKALRVIGERSCSLSSSGRVVIAPSRPAEKTPLTYEHAYGGKDAAAEARLGDPDADMRAYFLPQVDLNDYSHYAYPRNPCGTGYLLEATPDAVAQLCLPRLEDPEDPLTPDRLAVGSVGAWPRMPLPQAFDWVAHAWFPRLTYLGFLPTHDPLDGPVAEEVRGLVAPGVMTQKPSRQENFSFLLTSGASLGLQLPYLSGDEDFRLDNLHPKQKDYRFRLPGERPEIWTDGREGKFNKTSPVLHTVLIEPDEERLSLVWRGSAQALRPYSPEELDRMPFRVKW